MFGSDNIAAALETMRHDFHFPGHLVPGTAFMILGIWWSWSALKIFRENERRKYSDSLLKGERNEDVPDLFPFLATYNGEAAGTFRCEGFYKVAYASYDLFCHFLAVIYGGDLADEWQHMTVYVFFILNGIIDVIAHKRIYKLPKGTEYLGSAIAWAALGMLFISHTHGKTKIAVFYHQQFGWLAVSIAVITLLQWKYDQNILIALTRSSCVTFAGTWLYQIAFMFHNPFIAANQYRNVAHHNHNHSHTHAMNSMQIGEMSDKSQHMDMDNISMEVMNAVTIFTWHIILVGCVAVLLGCLANRRKRDYYKLIRTCSV